MLRWENTAPIQSGACSARAAPARPAAAATSAQRTTILLMTPPPSWSPIRRWIGLRQLISGPFFDLSAEMPQFTSLLASGLRDALRGGYRGADLGRDVLAGAVVA